MFEKGLQSIRASRRVDVFQEHESYLLSVAYGGFSSSLPVRARLFDWLAFQPRFSASPLSEKVSHGTTTRPSRDSRNIGRRLAGPSSASAINRGTRDAMRLRKKGQRGTRAACTRRRCNAAIETARSTNRPIIRLDR